MNSAVRWRSVRRGCEVRAGRAGTPDIHRDTGGSRRMRSSHHRSIGCAGNGSFTGSDSACGESAPAGWCPAMIPGRDSMCGCVFRMPLHGSPGRLVRWRPAGIEGCCSWTSTGRCFRAMRPTRLRAKGIGLRGSSRPTRHCLGSAVPSARDCWRWDVNWPGRAGGPRTRTSSSRRSSDCRLYPW